MSCKAIVVHLDQGERCTERTRISIAMAARFRSRLIGVSATGAPDVLIALNAAVPDRVQPIARSAATLKLLCVAEHVALRSVTEEAAHDDSGRFEAVRLWLATHGVRAELRQSSSAGSVGDRLLGIAAGDGIDLLIAGAYGHSRLREWALGGVTRHLLRHATVPTPLSH